MPLLPASLIEPLWAEFAALIGSGQRPEFSPAHPWGCHRRRVPDRVVFDHVIAAPVHGSGYERLASPGCPDRTIRRRLTEWAQAGIGPELLRIGLVAYDRMIGLRGHPGGAQGHLHHQNWHPATRAHLPRAGPAVNSTPPASQVTRNVGGVEFTAGGSLTRI